MSETVQSRVEEILNIQCTAENAREIWSDLPLSKGKIAKDARVALEDQTGGKVVTAKNNLLPGNAKRIKKQ